MRILWNPWRYNYIKQFSGNKEEERKECLFCKLQKMKDDEAYIVYRGKSAFVVLNAYPYNSGHLMITPYSHVPEPTFLNEESVLEIMLLVNKSLKALRKAFNPDGFNIGANIGRAAGAGVPDHFHIHVVPRWVGDTNFIAIIANTKPLPISLQESYEIIKKAWSEVE
ncbi:MAG: HIT domain-containing protein [Desulfurococcaceae archaeon]